MDDLDVVVAERVELGPRVRDAAPRGTPRQTGRRAARGWSPQRGEEAGAAAYVEKGVAGLEVEELSAVP